jgi:hypothetical protein
MGREVFLQFLDGDQAVALHYILGHELPMRALVVLPHQP